MQGLVGILSHIKSQVTIELRGIGLNGFFGFIDVKRVKLVSAVGCRLEEMDVWDRLVYVGCKSGFWCSSLLYTAYSFVVWRHDPTTLPRELKYRCIDSDRTLGE